MLRLLLLILAASTLSAAAAPPTDDSGLRPSPAAADASDASAGASDAAPGAAAARPNAPAGPGPGDASDLATQAARLFGPTLEQTPLTGWFILLGAILLGLVAGRIVQAVMLRLAGKMRSRNWLFRAAVLRHIAGPASLALLTLALGAALTSSIYLGPDARTFALKLIAFLYLIAFGWFAFNSVELIDIGLRRITADRINEGVVTLIRKALRIFVLVLFGLFVADNIFGANITTWLAGLGIAGLAVSLAAQDPIKNLFGSLTVLIERPFIVGDRVIFDGNDGTIEEIGFRSTRIRLLSGHLVTVPNMKFTDRDIENITARPSVRRMLNITITYDTSPEKVEEAVQIVRSIFEEPEVANGFNLPDQAPRVFFSEFNADSLNIFAIYWYAINRAGHDWWTYQVFNQMVNLRLLRAFNEAGIDFAFPTQTLHLAGAPKRKRAIPFARKPAQQR